MTHPKCAAGVLAGPPVGTVRQMVCEGRCTDEVALAAHDRLVREYGRYFKEKDMEGAVPPKLVDRIMGSGRRLVHRPHTLVRVETNGAVPAELAAFVPGGMVEVWACQACGKERT